MKPKVLLLFLFISFNTLSQSQNFKGKYLRNLIVSEKDTIRYKLNLNSDGTFFFHSYTYNERDVPIIVNRYGKGNWIVSDLLISFVTKEEDIDQKHQLNFTNTTARFITKHHRDISDKVVHNRLLFFESDIDWIPKVEMFKQ